MRRRFLMFLIIVAVSIAGACGNSESSNKTTQKASEVKTQTSLESEDTDDDDDDEVAEIVVAYYTNTDVTQADLAQVNEAINGDILGVTQNKDNVSVAYYTMRTDILEDLGLMEKAQNISTIQSSK